MALQFCEYLSNGVVLSLLPLLCNHGNLTLKLHQKKYFVGRFKVGCLPRMINKEMFSPIYI